MCIRDRVKPEPTPELKSVTVTAESKKLKVGEETTVTAKEMCIRDRVIITEFIVIISRGMNIRMKKMLRLDVYKRQVIYNAAIFQSFCNYHSYGVLLS